ncbi:class I SAM-dependent methyltransferase [Pseudomonas abietaniphila]|uniref:class I SAM-dependent methyltransferase n=1 Tax=Pseudomonas abietaniphila TaxID=89065 RepID=UPI003216BB87
MSEFYRSFEDKHRGSRELILSRLNAYKPFIEKLRAHWDLEITDLGCGRGEWLELLTSMQVRCHGVDLNEAMLSACTARGLSVTKNDAISYLKQLPAGSQMVVSGFHLAEHIPFDQLQVLVQEAKRVLVPGGLLILETPNPENLLVGTSSFYMDPTHVNPLPPPLLQFLPEHYGYARATVLRLQEPAPLEDIEQVTLMDVLSGVSPDYSIVAQTVHAEGEGPDLDALFATPFGVTLAELAQGYEERVSRVENTAVNAVDMVRALEKNVAALQQNLTIQIRSLELENRILRDENARFSDQLLAQKEKIHEGEVVLAEHGAYLGVLTSQLGIARSRLHALSVIIPSPIVSSVRYVLLQGKLLKKDGVKTRSKLMARKVVFFTIRKLAPIKPLKKAGVFALKKLGAYEILRTKYIRKDIQIFRPAVGHTVNIGMDNLSPHGRNVLAKLKLAEKIRDRNK